MKKSYYCLFKYAINKYAITIKNIFIKYYIVSIYIKLDFTFTNNYLYIIKFKKMNI